MPSANDGLFASAGLVASLRDMEGGPNGGGYYNDPAHNCTRGTGILVHFGDCTAAELAMPPDDATNQLDLTARIHRAEQQVRDKVPDRLLTRDQFDALVSATFNLGGAGALPVLQAANRGDDPAVVAALHARVVANVRGPNGLPTGRVVRLPGLVTRREREAQPFMSQRQ